MLCKQCEKTIYIMAISSTFSGLFGGFTSNITKLRKVAMDYFASEGIACEIKDGELLFKFNDSIYTLQLGTGDDYAECAIVYECNADEYLSLDPTDKAFVADKVNTDLYNHATVYAYTDSIKIDSTFYFTSKKMWVELFIKHFNELNESVRLAFDIIGDMVTSADEAEKPKKIGFCVPEQDKNENDNDVAVVAKK